MTLTQALIGFAGIAFLITIIPATDTALVLRSLVAGGRRSAYACVFGITAGLLIWGITAATGLAVLMAAAPLVFDLITVAGGLYLIYLGIKFLLNLRRWGQVTALKTDQAALASLPAPAASLPGASGADAPAGEHRGFSRGLHRQHSQPQNRGLLHRQRATLYGRQRATLHHGKPASPHPRRH
ncbi:LysE family translocator [Rothia nasimurium]|uniref:LysE family translocator n=1 Tax=Rothia nasimurium TaxID=85336 RepID=UPI0036150327